MPTNKKPLSSENKNISIGGDVKDSVVISGDNNTVNKTTIIQKFFNIFKSDAETLEQRNRRLLLGHVENAWIKGVLDASLHGAALLDLGIKQDPEAVTKYPWAIKKESTNETLPAGKSMLEIFDTTGMGRSLLILGAPGSGKTTMLLELARGLIARAREDITQPIPMVFNLASWTEKLTLADWLAQELNNLYSVPRKTAPDWVKGNKLLLLLDGLDEVRQESRAKCVDAINEFRKQNGLTSLAVCSRSQDYADIKVKLAFEGAIEVQPLTQEQITEFFNRFGKEMAGIKQVLKKDSALREMAETPLFLSIMIMAYQDKQDVDILVSGDEKAQRKHLFDSYIDRMFERRQINSPKSIVYKKLDVLHQLSWLSEKMIRLNQIPFLIEGMQPVSWLGKSLQRKFFVLVATFFVLVLVSPFIYEILFLPVPFSPDPLIARILFLFSVLFVLYLVTPTSIQTVDKLQWNLAQGFTVGVIIFLLISIVAGMLVSVAFSLFVSLSAGVKLFLLFIYIGLSIGIVSVFVFGIETKQTDKSINAEQKLLNSIKNSGIIFLVLFTSLGLYFLIASAFFLSVLTEQNIIVILMTENVLLYILLIGLGIGIGGGLWFGGFAVVLHYSLRATLSIFKILPFRLTPFLDHCVDLIFLRRVGGGYIFVHRLLMEHFTEMYVETPTSKGK